MTITKTFLSASINGRQILVTGTASGSATPIHTTPAGTSSIDEIWIYASNVTATTASYTINLNWGGTVSPGDVTNIILTGSIGRTLLTDGKLLNNGLIVGAWCTTANTFVIDGYVNRLTY